MSAELGSSTVSGAHRAPLQQTATLPSSGKVELEAVGVKNPDTAINARGEVMQVMATVVVVLPGHAVILDFH